MKRFTTAEGRGQAVAAMVGCAFLFAALGTLVYSRFCTSIGALGLYKPIVDFAGAGATVPLLGFGYALARGAIEGVKETGILGAFTGGVTAAAGGIAAAVFFGYLAAVLFKPKMKS